MSLQLVGKEPGEETDLTLYRQRLASRLVDVSTVTVFYIGPWLVMGNHLRTLYYPCSLCVNVKLSKGITFIRKYSGTLTWNRFNITRNYYH